MREQEDSVKVLVTKATTKDITTDVRTPRGYQDAINSPEGKDWSDAMDYELSKLVEMNTWTEIEAKDVPENAQVLPGMWVHIVKRLETGENKFRSRWVVRGDKQKTNISLSDTFAPVSRITSLRILLALATLKNLRIFTWDVDSAYLHGKLDHDIYIKFPDGYEKPGKVGKLNKALYGLPEAARVWREDLEEKLAMMGLIPLASDTGVFAKKTAGGLIAIDTHVDDATGICSSEGEELELKAGIQKFYKIKEKDTSKPFKVLGILVTRDTNRGILKISQSEYIDSLLQRFNMLECNPVVTPVDKGAHLHVSKEPQFENVREYQALTGSLTYAAMSTRPDIAYITQFLSQSNTKPTQSDWNAAKRVLRYLKGTKDLGIIYRGELVSDTKRDDH